MKCLNTQLNETTNQNSVKVPKVDKKNVFGDYWNIQPIVPLSLWMKQLYLAETSLSSASKSSQGGRVICSLPYTNLKQGQFTFKERSNNLQNINIYYTK